MQARVFSYTSTFTHALSLSLSIETQIPLRLPKHTHTHTVRPYLLVLQMSTGIHGQTTSTAAETVALRTVFAGVAVLAEQLLLVLGAVGGVQRLVAQACQAHGHVQHKDVQSNGEHGVRKRRGGGWFILVVVADVVAFRLLLLSGCRFSLLLTALEAGLVVFVTSGDALLSGVHRLLALGAFRVFHRLERHGDGVCLSRPGLGSGLVFLCSGVGLGWKERMQLIGWQIFQTTTYHVSANVFFLSFLCVFFFCLSLDYHAFCCRISQRRVNTHRHTHTNNQNPTPRTFCMFACVLENSL